MNHNPQLEIEKSDGLDPTPNLELEHHSDWHLLLFVTLAVSLIIPLMVVCAVLVFDWAPTWKHADIIITLWLLSISLPTFVAGYLHLRNLLWRNRHMRLLLRWTEKRMQMDLDGDGNVGIVLHDQSWFIEAVKHWFSGGSTKYEASTKALGITYAQWKAARTALIGSGIAIGVRRQGGSQGFEIKKKSWNDILVAMPATPQVYTDDTIKPAIPRVYSDGVERVSSIRD